MGLLFLIFGLVWWFPIGLFLLAAFLVSRAIGHWHVHSCSGRGSAQRLGMLVGVSGKAGWSIAPPAGADAALEIGETNFKRKSCVRRYRDETLRRLEDEQREFKDFLQRLRVAKDRVELDEFLSERPKSLERPQT